MKTSEWRKTMTHTYSIIPAVFTCMLIAFSGCVTENTGVPPGIPVKERIVMLSNGNVEVGVAPRFAGRVVLFRRTGGSNVIHSDASMWELPEEKIQGLVVSNFTFQDFSGHTVWAGPQREWYQHQDMYPEKRSNRHDWPPDPYTELAPFIVTSLSATNIVLVGPVSPLSGLQFTKSVSVDERGIVSLSVSAQNRRRSSVSWDLWANTRLPAKSTCYIPIDRFVRIVTGPGWSRNDEPLSYSINDGLFSIDTAPPVAKGKPQRAGKAYIENAPGIIAAFTGASCFIKRVPPVRKRDIHPEQATVEVYSAVSTNGGLMELENHSAYRTLEPGEAITMDETWELISYAGARDRSAHIAFMKKHAVIK